MTALSKESQIILAIEALKWDPKLSRRKAASIYNVAETTLRARMNSRILRCDYRPKTHKLTAIEEEVIVKYILDLDTRGFSPWLTSVEDMANLLLAERVSGRVGKR